MADLLDLLDREGCGLAALDFALDTLTDDGRQALRTLAAEARDHPASDLPIPPGELMFRVVADDIPGRFDVGGRLAAAGTRRALEWPWIPDLRAVKASLTSAAGLVGCYAISHARVPTATLYGADQDQEAIDWVQRELPFGTPGGLRRCRPFRCRVSSSI